MLVMNPINLERLCEAITAHAGSIPKACKDLGLNLRHVNAWILRDGEAAAAVRSAQQEGWASLEDVAYERAVNGYEKPVYQKGELAGYETVYSDSLLALMLKSRVPGYKQESDGGRGINVNVAIMPRANSYEEWVVQRDLHLDGVKQKLLAAPEEVTTVDFEPVDPRTALLRDIL